MFPSIELTQKVEPPSNLTVQFRGESPQNPTQEAEEQPRSNQDAGDRLAETEVSSGNVYLSFEGNTAAERWRFTMRKFLDDPGSSKMAFWFAFWMTITIIVSVVVFCVSTLRQYDGNDKAHRLFFSMELGFNIVFTIELVTRLAISTSMADLLSNVYLYFDFFAVVPFWIELFPVVAKGGGDSLNIMKALRILRLLKLARQFQGSVILAKAIQLSLQALMVPLFFLLLACLLFASFIYYLELEAVEAGNPSGDDTNNDPAFDSIPHALWFMVVTMTTVGYGDVSPNTSVGKFICVFAMIFGVLFLSMPLAIVGQNFTDTWNEKERVIFIEKLKEDFSAKGMEDKSIVDFFNLMDVDNSGTIDFKEFKEMLVHMELKLAKGEVAKLWHTIDEDKSGYVTVEELLELVHGKGSGPDDAVGSERLDHQHEAQLPSVTRDLEVLQKLRELKMTLHESLVRCQKLEERIVRNGLSEK